MKKYWIVFAALVGAVGLAVSVPGTAQARTRPFTKVWYGIEPLQTVDGYRVEGLPRPTGLKFSRSRERNISSESKSAWDQHPIIEVEQHRRIVFVTGFVGKIRAWPVAGRNGAQPQGANVLPAG